MFCLEKKYAYREKMICRMLLLLILISSVCAATFVVNVTQSSYQAEENHNITLEWTFTTKPDVSSNSLYIYCELKAAHKLKVLFHVFKGVEASLHPDEQFAGRVQSDKDVLREGRIRLHVSRLRTNDSGLYVCDVKTDYGFNSEKCQLNVTAAAGQDQLQRPTENQQPDNRGRIVLFAALGLIAAAAAAALMIKLISIICFNKSTEKTTNFRSAV